MNTEDLRSCDWDATTLLLPYESFEKPPMLVTDTECSSVSDSIASTRSSSPSPLFGQVPVDDISIKVDPDRHVDYLSHDWSENDIWVSWRQVTKQKAFLQSGARLENASWRTWAKSRNKLKTISPETLNWLKDCDVTWLYGPLHRGTSFSEDNRKNVFDPATLSQDGGADDSDAQERRHNSKPVLSSVNSAFVIPSRRISKPILKKRSNSEMMLARHNLITEDEQLGSSSTETVTKEQKALRPQAIRTHSANSVLRSARKQHFRKETGGDIPKRHIHFNESVEQCISIIKPDPEDDEYASDSSDDAPMMRISAPKTPSNIAKLPSTTLKLPSAGHIVQHDYTRSDDLDDLSDDDHALASHHESSFRSIPSGQNTTRSSRSNSGDSVILPNYDGNQAESPPAGIFGRAAEVVFSARDLVSVMWSASSGWRRTDPPASN